MSEKSTPVSESSTPLDSLQLALKKVYSVHKEKIKEVSDERDDFKEGCEVLLQHKARLLEKVRSLQNHNEVLYNENTQLRNLLDTVRSQDNRSGSCQTCDHLQRSLSAIQEAYKHSLDEKEKMIHYLEERVAELNRQSSPFNKQPELNLSNLLTPDKSINDGENSRPNSSKGKSPHENRQGEQDRDRQGTASKKILEAVTNRLGRESTQDHVLDGDGVKHDRGYRELFSEKMGREECVDDSSSLGGNSRRSDGKTCDSYDKASRKELATFRYKNVQGQEAIRSSHMHKIHSGDEVSKQDHVVSDRSHHHGRNQNWLYGVGRNEVTSTDTRPGEVQAQESVKSGQSSDDVQEKESPESSRQRRLGLGRNRGKRNRYTEDSSPDKKRQKSEKFDKPHVHNTSDECDETFHKLPAPSSHQSHVLVQETCDPDSDRTVSMSSDETPEKAQRGRRSSVVETNNTEYAVVPETLGMGLTSSESESDDDMCTQDTIKARSEVGSPSDILNSPPSDIESDTKLKKVSNLLNRGNSLENKKVGKKTLAERGDKDSFNHEMCSKSLVNNINPDCDKRKNVQSDIKENDIISRPSSPIFFGAKGSRRSVESPFLFDDDGPDSSKSIRKKSANMSVLLSDQESPLLLKPIDVAVHSTNCGQSPNLKETSRSRQGQKATTETPDQSHNKPDKKKSGMSSQNRQQMSVNVRNLRNSERLKQTTLSQAFTPSPPSLPFTYLSPTKPEERAAIDKAIRLSLQEIDTNRGVVKSKKPLFGKSKDKVVEANAVENVSPLFKKPPSPNTLKSPSKQRSPNKKSPPKQRLCKTSLSKGKQKQCPKEDVTDLDETVPPDSASLECLSYPIHDNKKANSGKAESVFSVNKLNESLDPDVSLTQYCSDTELLSQRHKTRQYRGLKSASQSLDIGPSLDIATSSGRKREKPGANSTSSSRLQRDCGKNQKARFSLDSKKESQNKLASLDEEYDTEPSTFRCRKNRSKETRHFTPNDGVSLDQDDCLVTSGVSKPSSSVEILSQGQGPSLDMEENEADVTMDPRFMRAHMYEAQMEESLSIPLSSCSYKFGKSSKSSSSGAISQEKKRDDDVNDEDDEEENTLTMEGQDDRRKSFNDSFDRVPQKQQANFAHVDVVRKRVERQQLKATTCQECYDYYKSKGLTEDEIQQQVQDCSRHRARYLPPSTPEHFWSIGFPDTQECEERGYIGKVSPSKKKPGYRRRRKLTKHFKSRQEEDGPESDTDTQT